MTCFQTSNLLSDLLCRQCEFLHLLLEVIDLVVVISQRADNTVFVFIDYDKVREPGKQVVDFEKVAFFKQGSGCIDIFLVL